MDDLDSPKLTQVERWSDEITQAELELRKPKERGRKVTKRYLDERDTMNAGDKWFNIFYANTNILESALYAQLPKPAVNRKFKDYDDQVARVAGIILQRAITQDLDDPRDTFDSTMRQCVQDRLVPGLAQAWLRLETSTEPVEMGETLEMPGMEPMEPEEPLQRITDQRVCVDYVFWEDFLWSPCRVWDERRWVARKVYMDREELIERFGEEKGRKVSLDYSPSLDVRLGSTPTHEAVKKAIVYEIWCRTDRKVYWYSKGCGEMLDEIDDPLGLVGFEPCPKPMLANISTSNTTPRPDYYMIQDQYTELDTVNNRISMLVQACKVVGVYDKGSPGVARMLSEGFDNQLIPVDNWAMFAEKNGLKGQIDWLPLEQVVTALGRLNEAREAIKGQIYELTGIADIVRGASKASETLGAQQIKAQFASVRIKKLQDEVARFASEIMRIKSEMLIKHFDPQILLERSNIMRTSDAPLAEQAVQLLQSEEGFEWRIQVTADSIAQADYAADKADRIEMLTAVASYMGKASQMIQTAPQSAHLLVSMLKWAVAGFRNAAEIEGVLDQELDKLNKQPPEDKPDPAAAQQQADQQKQQADMQMAQQRAQMDAQSKQQDMAVKQQLAQLDIQMKQQELQMKKQEMDMDLRMKQMELMFDGKRMKMDLEGLAAKAAIAKAASKEKPNA